MNKKKIQKEIEDYYKDRDISVKVVVNDSFSVLGGCFYNQHKIIISKYYDYLSEKDKKFLLEHEYLHLKYPKHDKNFNTEFQKLFGKYKIKSCIAKFLVICPYCGKFFFTNTISKKWNLICKKCSSEKYKQKMVVYRYDNLR